MIVMNSTALASLLLLFSAPDGNAQQHLDRALDAVNKCKSASQVFAITNKYIDAAGKEHTVFRYSGRLTFAEPGRLRFNLRSETSPAMEMSIDTQCIIYAGEMHTRSETDGPTEVAKVPDRWARTMLRRFVMRGILGDSFSPSQPNDRRQGGEPKLLNPKLGARTKIDGITAQAVHYEIARGAAPNLPVVLWLDAKTFLPLKRIITVNGNAPKVSKSLLIEEYRTRLGEPVNQKDFVLPSK